MIVRETKQTGASYRETAAKYFAEFNLFTHMAHYVARVLNIRPNEILDTWGVPELLVAYGQYMNEDVAERYASWKAIHGTDRKVTPPQPKKYAVRFMGVREMGE